MGKQKPHPRRANWRRADANDRAVLTLHGPAQQGQEGPAPDLAGPSPIPDPTPLYPSQYLFLPRQ